MKPASVLFVLVLAAASPPGALAQQAQPVLADRTDRAEQGAPPQQGQREPCPPPARGKTPARRAVRQQVLTMPPPSPPVAPAMPPVLAPSVPLPLPSAPMPSACGPAGCSRPDGTPIYGGVGNTMTDANGRQCVRNGASVQCF